MFNYPIRVLLIDDDEDNYVTVHSLFAEIGVEKFILDWVTNYTEAWQTVARGIHQIYLVDYRLGEESGLELLQEVAKHHRRAPMILLTGQGDREVDLAAMKAGAADYLVKGQIDAIVLERALRYAMERTRTMEELRQAVHEKSQLASAIANLTTGVIITDPYQSSNPVIFVNRAFTNITGYSAEEMIGQNCRILQGPETNPYTLNKIQAAIAERRSLTCTILNYRKDGTPFWNELTISPVFDAAGRLMNFVGLQTDVTERKRSQQALRESEERYALALQGANDGIWDWNLKTNQIYFSARWKAMLGFAEDEVDQTPEEWFSRVHPDDINWLRFRLNAHLDGLTPDFEHEHRVRHRDGRYCWVLNRGLAVRDAHGQVTRMAGSQTDITARKQAEEQLLHDALHDALTGLPNRTLLMERLRYGLQIVKHKPNYRFAVMFLDVDRFKVVNDSLGHIVGDRLLLAIAQRLSACLRPGDTIARLGGDEFVILLEDIRETNDVIVVADRIQEEIAQPFNLNGYEIFTSVSIGIALSDMGYDWSEDMLRDADTAMYRAKAQGKACYKIFDISMHVYAVTLLQLETDLRRAIERQEFCLHYQPIISLKTSRISGFEALIRWQHPSRGIIAPTEFIPIAEETGLIIPIGRWVLREACQQMRQWQLQFPTVCPLSISVNLSGKQLMPDLPQHIQQILQITELDAQCLKLEITESVLIENTDTAATLLTQIQALGIQLSIDDFGTGYSSLSYLHRFPIDILKIDQSFVNRLEEDPERLAIVRTIISLAWNLRMDVIAEGVETLSQMNHLKQLNCEYGQGFYFSPALDSTAATQFIEVNSVILHEQSDWPHPGYEMLHQTLPSAVR
jgi:diguanylate cyclase (GGDEF)-like protein/PAS domain S-box-containing protein